MAHFGRSDFSPTHTLRPGPAYIAHGVEGEAGGTESDGQIQHEGENREDPESPRGCEGGIVGARTSDRDRSQPGGLHEEVAYWHIVRP